MNMKPVLSAPPPINPPKVSTAGSLARMSATFCTFSDMAAKEMSCPPSEKPTINPVSCCGKNPLGSTLNIATVATTVLTATARVIYWWRSTHFRPRSYSPSIHSKTRSIAS